MKKYWRILAVIATRGRSTTEEYQRSAASAIVGARFFHFLAGFPFKTS
jgi:hypothetical protein